MNRVELEALPLEERRRLQREVGLETLSYARQQAQQTTDRYRPHRRGRHGQQKKEESKMEPQVQPVATTNKTSAQRSVEEFTNKIEQVSNKLGQGEDWVASAKRASAYAAIWSPVALGVGYALLRMGRRMFVPVPLP